MPLMIDDKPIGSVPQVLEELFSRCPCLKESSEKFRHQKVTKVLPVAGLLYVGQREMAATTPDDDVVQVIGTEDATTCHMIVLRHTGSGAVCLAHFDESGLGAAAKTMIQLVTSLSKNKVSQGRFELHILGGFHDGDGTSDRLSRKTLNAFHDNKEEIHLVTACITDLNNTKKEVKNRIVDFPEVYGIAVNVKTGKVFRATFPDHGPDQPVRSARHFTGTEDVINIYDSSKHLLIIGPFNYKTMEEIDLLAQLPDEFIRENLSTSPEQEPEHFEASVRAALIQIRDHPEPLKTVFKDGKPRCYCFENGNWKKSNDEDQMQHAMQQFTL